MMVAFCVLGWLDKKFINLPEYVSLLYQLVKIVPSLSLMILTFKKGIALLFSV